MEIITGYTGKPHVTAEQDRDVNEGIFDTGSFVLKTGSQLAAELVSNNEIKVRDGVLVIQGCTAVIKKNTYERGNKNRRGDAEGYSGNTKCKHGSSTDV